MVRAHAGAAGLSGDVLSGYPHVGIPAAHASDQAGLSADAADQACRRKAMRIGFSTVRASKAAMTLRTAATTNTACQLPVAAVSTLARGTSSAAVPLAV